MPDLFNDDWMKKFQSIWNKDPELTSPLKEIRFSSTIGYGFTDEDTPRGCITVENGKIIDAGRYSGQALHWDLRAKEIHWQEWLNREVSKAGFGLAYSTGKLRFLSGDYRTINKNPHMAGPFVKSFSAMGRV